MSRMLVVYGTTDGQTAKVALALASRFRARGHDVDIVNAAAGGPNPGHYDAAVVAASLHAGKYQHGVVRWVKESAPLLNAMPTAFVSLCLGVLEHKPEVDRHLQSVIEALRETTGWRPLEVKIVAGALKYTQYNFLKRWLMKRIVRKAGGDTDTSRDYEYTDWADLDRFADAFAARVRVPAAAVVNAARSA